MASTPVSLTENRSKHIKRDSDVKLDMSVGSPALANGGILVISLTLVLQAHILPGKKTSLRDVPQKKLNRLLRISL